MAQITTMPTSRNALVTSKNGGRLELAHDVEIPSLQPDMMLCRVRAVGLNPGDVKSSDYTSCSGLISGFDFAGEILEVGVGVERFKKGDRIAGFAHGYNSDDKSTGAFSDIVLADQNFALVLPEDWTYGQGAVLGTALGTAGFALSHYLNIPLPVHGCEERNNDGGEYVLVSGGATATGIMAIQLLSMAGFRPVATCSPAKSALVRSLGAVATFDYHSSTCGADIRLLTRNKLTRVLDCITTAESMTMCYTAIGSSGGRYIGLDPISPHVKYSRRDVSADWAMAVAMFGYPVRLVGDYGRAAAPALRELAKGIYSTGKMLISKGFLQRPLTQIRAGGLAAVIEGIDDLRQGRVTGTKLVYKLD